MRLQLVADFGKTSLGLLLCHIGINGERQFARFGTVGARCNGGKTDGVLSLAVNLFQRLLDKVEPREDVKDRGDCLVVLGGGE